MEVMFPDTALIIFLILGLALLAVWVFTLVDVFRGEFAAPHERVLWVLLIIFAPFIGCILYFLIGRKNKINFK